MMTFYRKTYHNTTRAAFARDAAIDAFGPKAISSLDDGGFEDRRPDYGPRPLGKIAAKTTNDIGIQALRHWLNQAGQADSDEEREAALEIAAEIARLLGLPASTTGCHRPRASSNSTVVTTKPEPPSYAVQIGVGSAQEAPSPAAPIRAASFQPST